MVEKGQKVKLRIDDLAYGGDGVGRMEDGLVVFVPYTIPGEKVKIEITEIENNFARSQLKEVLQPSLDRTTSRCPVFGKCGGCHLQHLKYDRQLEAKKSFIRDSLSRIGDLPSIEVETVLEADYPWYYRNKAQYPLIKDTEGRICAGFYARGTHQPVINEKCFIQHQLINRIKRETLAILNDYQLSVYDEQKETGFLRHLVIRIGACTNQALLIFVTSGEDFPHHQEIVSRIKDRVPELKGILQNINSKKSNVILGAKTISLWGEEQFFEYLGQTRYKISPTSFFQVNTLQAEKMSRVIEQKLELTGQEILVDAYSGAGSLGLYLAGKCDRVIGIEKNPEAVTDARQNAEINEIDNCRFIEGRVEQKLPELREMGIDFSVVLVDPPRKGLTDEFRSLLLAEKPEKIVYVSCNPSTLARDLAQITTEYEITDLKPIDMFPQTYHVETVTVLKKE